jgi:NAD+ synthase (glutamine-hydrolysing)
MRLMLAQLNPTVGDFEGNLKKILSTIETGRSQGVSVIAFPELVVCGYPPEDLLLHPTFVQAAERCLPLLQEASRGLTLFVGTIRRHLKRGEKGLFNTVAIFQDQQLKGFVDKQLLPTYDVFDERRYFEPGEGVHVEMCQGKKIGVLVCEDMWQHAGLVGETDYKVDPVEEMRALCPDLVINLSASPYQFEKVGMRIDVAAASAKTLSCPVGFCCQVGGNDRLVFDGYSFCVDAEGDLRVLAKGFEEDCLILDLDCLPPKRPLPCNPLEDLYKALVLGVRDYLHKSGLKKGCLGLSGGIDSALVACIAVDALGKENVLAVAMPSRYSAPDSLFDAQLLAERLGIEMLSIPIERPFVDFLDLLTEAFQGRPEDVTEENIQARIRGLLLMALSNKLGHIVLSTGNKSEMGMGYCTLYGDMCGGLSVISDVTKRQVYALCEWINRHEEIIPQRTLQREPSAELRADQKDSDSLPSYDVVDAVVQDYVERYKKPEEIAEHNNIPLATVLDLIAKIHRAEYKRGQAAPGIRVSKKAFQAGRRYPIVQKWIT